MITQIKLMAERSANPEFRHVLRLNAWKVEGGVWKLSFLKRHAKRMAYGPLKGCAPFKYYGHNPSGFPF